MGMKITAANAAAAARWRRVRTKKEMKNVITPDLPLRLSFTKTWRPTKPISIKLSDPRDSPDKAYRSSNPPMYLIELIIGHKRHIFQSELVSATLKGCNSNWNASLSISLVSSAQISLCAALHIIWLKRTRECLTQGYGGFEEQKAKKQKGIIRCDWRRGGTQDCNHNIVGLLYLVGAAIQWKGADSKCGQNDTCNEEDCGSFLSPSEACVQMPIAPSIYDSKQDTDDYSTQIQGRTLQALQH